MPAVLSYLLSRTFLFTLFCLIVNSTYSQPITLTNLISDPHNEQVIYVAIDNKFKLTEIPQKVEIQNASAFFQADTLLVRPNRVGPIKLILFTSTGQQTITLQAKVLPFARPVITSEECTDPSFVNKADVLEFSKLRLTSYEGESFLTQLAIKQFTIIINNKRYVQMSNSFSEEVLHAIAELQAEDILTISGITLKNTNTGLIFPLNSTTIFTIK